ncbi:hypothetical protein C0993_000254 [Termitomyces sp. T159_Od127]|nr:hypothetical protein C0993_000254 [Termitomyces sp. T159_Od127]
MSDFPIHSAAQNKQLSLLRALVVENPKDVDSLDQDGRTPLHWAASSGAIDIVRLLIDLKAVVDEPDISGWTPLHVAGLVTWLVRVCTQTYLLLNSVSAGHDDIVKELVGAGADVNRKNDKGITPLHYAASKSRIDVCRDTVKLLHRRLTVMLQIGKLLIARGADINAKDKANQVPLHRAATTGSVGFIRLLLDSSNPGVTKTRLNASDRIGNTPLHLAMESAHAEAAVILINAGADRTRVGFLQMNGEAPEDVLGVGGSEQRQAKQHVIDNCGKP